MTTSEDLAQGIQASLAPFVRPRDEVYQIRRTLAAHLAACLKSDDDIFDRPLALIDVPWNVVEAGASAPETRGLQRAYLQALQTHLCARRAFDQVRQASRKQQCELLERQKQQLAGIFPGMTRNTAAGVASSISQTDSLDGHLETIRLTRKKERLLAVHRSLDALLQQPAAASEDYLQPAAIYAEATRTIPPVPKAVVDQLAAAAAAEEADQATGRIGKSGTATTTIADLNCLAAELEKAVLRIQLQLKQEEERLAVAKARTAGHVWGSGKPRTPYEYAARMKALEATRDELIAWMEAELGHAGGPGGEDDLDGENEQDAESTRLLRQSLLGGDVGSSGGHEHGTGNQQQRIEDKVAGIREKYARYVDVRRRLVHMLGSVTGDETGGGHTGAPSQLLAHKPNVAPGQQHLISEASSSPTSPHSSTTARGSAAAAHVALNHILLTPYLERLLAISHNQKANMAHKTHNQAVLVQRVNNTCQALSHLAEESQLLPQYPLGQGGGALPMSGEKKHEGSGKQQQQYVAAWTLAADACKLATFKAVAEHLDDGQSALERASQTLDEADQLLGRSVSREGERGAGEGDKSAFEKKGDIWAALHGGLGLAQAEKSM